MTTPELLSRLADAVTEMRHHQKGYFRTRSPTAMTAAKRAERRVDKLLDELAEPNLFSDL